MTANNPQIEILPDVLKSALAPFTGFQRDFQALTKGLNEFRSDLKLTTIETTRAWRDGLKVFTEGMDKLSSVLIGAGVGAGKQALGFDRLITDLQIDNKLTDGQRDNLSSRIKALAQKTGRNEAEIAEILKPLFDQLGEGFDKYDIGTSDLELTAERIARTVTAYAYNPQLFSEIIAPILRREGISGLSASELPQLLGKTAQDAGIEPGQLRSGLLQFHNKALGTGLKGEAAVAEFGRLATVAKNFEEDWAQRSALMMAFTEKLKSGRLENGKRLIDIMKQAGENGDSPVQAALEALAGEKDGGTKSLNRFFGTDTPDRGFAGFMLQNRENLSPTSTALKEQARKDVDTAFANRRNSADGAVQDLGRAGDRLSNSLTEGLLPAVRQASQALIDWANQLSGVARNNPDTTAYAVGGLIAGAAGVKAIGVLAPFFNLFKKGGADSKAGAALAGTLSAPLPVYVVNLPGAGFEGRGLTPLLDGPGSGRRGSVPSAGGLGTLAAEVGERAPLSRGGGLFSRAGGLARGLLGRVVRPLGMIDDVTTVVSAAARGDRAGVGRGLGSGLGGLGGAMLGASIGSVIPVAGTLIGGLIGGALGSFGGSSLLERVMGGGGEAAGPPVPPLQAEALASKPESFADQLHKLAIELSISGLPEGGSAHARCRWDDFVEASYLGINVHNGVGNLRAGGPR